MTTTTATTTATTSTSTHDDDDLNGVYDETDLGHSGYGPYRYRLLSEPHLTRELARQSLCKTYQRADVGNSSTSTDHAASNIAYSVSLQPCCNPDALSQDRLVVESWPMRVGGNWTFAAVFDGHGGHDTADYALATLPSQIRSALSSYLSTSPGGSLDPEAISKLLASTMTAFDERIGQALLTLFPGGESQLANMSDEEINELVNDQDRGGKNATILARCMRGSTALVTLIDPPRENLWVANLGDCVAILGEMANNKSPTTPARSLVINTLHNGSNPGELERVEKEHPGEPHCMVRQRVLGALAVTRALGDHTFKLPNIYTERVFLNARDKFKTMTPMHEILPRIRTPPYVSNVPEVKHVSLVAAFSGGGAIFAAEVDAVSQVHKQAMAADADAADEPPPTPLRDSEPEPVLEQGEGGFDLEVVPPTPKVEDAVANFVDSDGGSDTESEGDGEFRQAVSEHLARNTEYGSVDMDGAAARVGVQKAKSRFLILASDGLQFLYDDVIVPDLWTDVVGRTIGGVDVVAGGTKNPALSLLRDALGGTDVKQVSSMLTVELEERWMDDTTIVVVPL